MLKNKLTLNKLIHKFTEKQHYLCQSKTSNELDIVCTNDFNFHIVNFPFTRFAVTKTRFYELSLPASIHIMN
jgi:hypothetical protein